jgi:hypothetical protein
MPWLYMPWLYMPLGLRYYMPWLYMPWLTVSSSSSDESITMTEHVPARSAGPCTQRAHNTAQPHSHTTHMTQHMAERVSTAHGSCTAQHSPAHDST